MRPNPAMRCRVFVPGPLREGAAITLDRDQAHYLRDVLRMRPGDALTVFDGSGAEFDAVIESLERSRARCRLGAGRRPEVELPVPVHLWQGLCRGEKLDWVVQKATELGAASITLVAAERSQVRLEPARRERRLARLRRIAIEAAEQSGRVRVPEIGWAASVAECRPEGLALCLHPHAECDWPDIRPRLANASAISLAIGPEGGWSEDEVASLAGRGWMPVRFGPRILRTETAGPALIAAVTACL